MSTNEYRPVWTAFLRNVLGWPDDDIQAFVAWIESIYPDPQMGLYHETAGYYVATFTISADIPRYIWLHSKDGENIYIAAFVRKIAAIIDRYTVGNDVNLGDIAWDRLRDDISLYMGRFGLTISSHKESRDIFLTWFVPYTDE